MKCKIDISGIHCLGCTALIKMSLEEAGFDNVEVSLENKHAFFETQKDLLDTKELLDNIFSDFTQYKYSNLVNI